MGTITAGMPTGSNARGMRCQDRGNEYLGNRLVNSQQIDIAGGDVTAVDWPGQGSHPASDLTNCQGNIGTLRIGRSFPGQNLPATNTSVRAHTGTITLHHQVNTRCGNGKLNPPTCSAAATKTIPRAVKFLASQVGPNS